MAVDTMTKQSNRQVLHFNGQVIGSVSKTLFSNFKPVFSAEVSLRIEHETWHLQGPATRAFEQLALALKQAGLCPHWRNELLSVRSLDGQIVGAIERGTTRLLGIRTQAVHLLGQSLGGNWLQQRAWHKSDDPGRWDTLSGGMVSHEETIDQALQRETFEEAGLRLADLEQVCYRGVLNIEEPTDHGLELRREELHWYTAHLPAALEPNNQDGEVIGFECVERSKLIKMLASDDLSADAVKIFRSALDQDLI
jgi:8-oxo-dGTP pyrophosphatase MutT (NUDIX family)